MLAMLKYALRYAPLLLLALLLVPFRIYNAGWIAQQYIIQPRLVASSSDPGEVLYGVTMLSANDVWAVGGSFVTECATRDRTSCSVAPSAGIIFHYTDGSWIAAKVSGTLKAPLFSVSLEAPNDGWAVGYLGALVHYDGHIWSPIAGPVEQNLRGVAMLSPSNGWAVGYSGTILHYDGKQWIRVPSPTPADLHSIAMPSAQEGWAVGNSGVILHYSNGGWSIIHSPTNNTINNVSMLSMSEGWAVGNNGTILHYRSEDGIWENVYPIGYYQRPYLYQSTNLLGIAMSSVRSGWIVGEQYFLTYSKSEVWVEPDRSGKIIYPAKSLELPLAGLILYGIILSSSDQGWAVGSATNGNGENSIVILHYSQGAWTVAS